MSAFLTGILKITLITDLTIGLVWLLSLCLRGGSGYQWRKLVWLFLGLRLLIPATISFADISGQLPLIRVELNEPVNNRQVDSAAAKANGLKEQEEAGAVPDSWEGAGSPQDSLAAGGEADRIADPGIPAAAEKGERLKADPETGLPESGMFKSRLPLSVLLACFWLAGILAAARFHISQYLHTRKCLLETARPCRDKETECLAEKLFREYGINRTLPLLISDTVDTPMVTGYIKPVLLLDEASCRAPEREAMLRHELCHYKYGDLWYKLLMVAVCDLYWFNPVLRLMKRMAFCDVECVCDSRATRRMGPEEKKSYAYMLVTRTRGKSTAYSARFSAGRKTMKERLDNLFTDKKNKTGYAAALVLLAAVSVFSMSLVFTGKDGSDGTGSAGEEMAAGEEKGGKENDGEEEHAVQPVKTFRVDSVADLYLEEPFQPELYYLTNRVTLDNHFYIDEDKVLWGYGRNSFGQLGIGKKDTDDAYYGEPVRIAEHVVSVDQSVNGYFTIYLTEDGNLYGMGSNLMGVLGKPLDAEPVLYDYSRYVRVLEPTLLMEQVAYARAGMYSIVALKEDGSVWWWGEYKALSATSYENSYADGYWAYEEWPENPRKMMYTSPRLMLEDCIYATTGNWTGAAITRDGELYTWGFNIWGQCGTPVTADDYVRMPQKVLGNVKMVWPERMAFSDSRTAIPEFASYNTSYNNNLFVQLKDGTLLACGLDLGTKTKTIQLEGDMLQPVTKNYSDRFVPIAVCSLTDADIRSILDQCEKGSTVEEAEQILEDHQLFWLECFEEGGKYPLYLEVEEGRYYLYFDDNGRVTYFSDQGED